MQGCQQPRSNKIIDTMLLIKGGKMTTGKIISEDYARKIGTALTVIVMLSVMLTGNPVFAACDSAGCVAIESDLGMKLCVEYSGKQYEFKLDYFPDSSGLLWKMDDATFKEIPFVSGKCNSMDSGLNIKICCAYFHTYKCSFTLNFKETYWEMDWKSFQADYGDPLTAFQWHIQNTGQTAFSKSGGTKGEDLRMDKAIADQLSGAGIIMAIVDSGLEIAHEDIAGNIIPNGSYNYVNNTTDPTNTTKTDGDHGTSVAGIAAAVSMNGKGGRGVAPRVSLKGFNALITQSATDRIYSLGGHTRSKDVDIFNMSYGLDGLSYISLTPTYKNFYDKTPKELRGGKGGIYVKSAGNEFDDTEDDKGKTYTCTEHNGIKGLTCWNAAADEQNSRPEVITVGAFNASGVRSSYSTAGSTLWVSAPGGEKGTDSPAIITIDQTGTEKGYSRHGINKDEFPFDVGDPTYNPNCNYTNTMNGTSSAAPNASGAIALILQANPNLTRRDVKHILAKTARKIDPESKASYVTVKINGADYQASEGWVTNAAGYNFHNWYGFGAVNVDAAVAMAKNYQADSLPKLLPNKTFGSDLATAVEIPDNNASGVTRTIDVSEDLTIENLFVQLSITHPDTSEVGIEITSPRGTKSILLNIRSSIKEGLDEKGGVILGSNAFYGEKTKGTWTLKVLDSVKEKTGTLDLFKLNIMGY